MFVRRTSYDFLSDEVLGRRKSLSGGLRHGRISYPFVYFHNGSSSRFPSHVQTPPKRQTLQTCTLPVTSPIHALGHAYTPPPLIPLCIHVTPHHQTLFYIIPSHLRTLQTRLTSSTPVRPLHPVLGYLTKASCPRFEDTYPKPVNASALTVSPRVNSGSTPRCF